MELVTASDLFVTASLALILSFLVAKLVSLAMTDTQTTTNHHVYEEPVGPVLHGERFTVQSKHQFNDEPVAPVLHGDRFTVQTTQSESKVEFISPVQVATMNVEETGENIKEDATVEFESPAKPDIAVVDEIKEKEKIAESSDDSTEQRKTECVEEIIEEPSTEVVVSVAKEKDEENGGDGGDDDDWEWEGIERSELEKVFMAATEFVGVGGNDGRFGSDVQMELYGLHKVATEGPCREPQPMPLKLSARAKWNAWQKLGNMSPEVAMEQYISLLSDKVSGWMKHTSSAGMGEHEPTGSEVSEPAAPDLSTSLSHQQMIVAERELEQKSGAQDRSPLTESDFENNVKK